MYKIPANTLFVGKNLVYVPECHSTNTLAAELSQKKGTSDGTVVITDSQTAGRGQRGNTWESEAGKNLTLSVIFRPSFLEVRDQFSLTIVVSLAVRALLTELLSDEVKIKWPNDILVHDRKICGILIENSLSGDRIQHSIVGIGLNINQESLSIATATSMALCAKKQFDPNEILTVLLEKLESYYLQLRSGMGNRLLIEYLLNLYWMGEERVFRMKGEEVRGRIEGVDQAGRLILKVQKEIRLYDLKEIAFVK